MCHGGTLSRPYAVKRPQRATRINNSSMRKAIIQGLACIGGWGDPGDSNWPTCSLFSKGLVRWLAGCKGAVYICTVFVWMPLALSCTRGGMAFLVGVLEAISDIPILMDHTQNQRKGFPSAP